MNMKRLEDGLLAVGGLVFLWATFMKVFGMQCWFSPGTYWRGAMGCAAFAIALLLRDLRDRQGMRS